MKQKAIIPKAQLIKCLENNYGFAVDHLQMLHVGADQDARIFKAVTANDMHYFVKQKYDHNFNVSIELMEVFRNAGIKLIIPPTKTIQGASHVNIESCSLIVYPFVEGVNGFEKALTESQWFNLGQVLRQIHEIELPKSLQQQIRKEAFSSQWRERVKELLENLSRISPQDEVASNLLIYMQTHVATISTLLEQADHLSKRLKNQISEFKLCHSDIHAGNVLIDHNNSLHIVDWDHPIMAPRERDLMFIGGGVGNVWNTPDQEKCFYQGYGKIDINYEMLAYYRFERIVEDIALYGHDLLLTAAGGEQRSVMYGHFTDMFQPRGVVDIALRTQKP